MNPSTIKNLASTLLLIFSMSLAAWADDPPASVVFLENFNTAGDLNNQTPEVGGNWSVTGGSYTVNEGGYLDTNDGNSSSNQAFAEFTRALAAGDKLFLSFSTRETAGAGIANSGWVGISLYHTDTSSPNEVFFLGSPGNKSEWGIDGKGVTQQVFSPPITADVQDVFFIYDYDTRNWEYTVGDQTLSGTTASSLALDRIRIGADIEYRATMAIDYIQVEFNAAEIDNITIGTESINGSWGDDAPDVAVWTPEGPDAEVPATEIETRLNEGKNVVITTGSGFLTEPGNIIVSSTLTWTTTSKLTLDAKGAIVVNEDREIKSTSSADISFLASEIDLRASASIVSDGGQLSLLTSKLDLHSSSNIAAVDGTLTIQPLNDNQTIGIGGASGDLELEASHFTENFAEGFAEIVIGSDNQTGNISLKSISFRDNVRLQTNGKVIVIGNETITLPHTMQLQVDNDLQLDADAEIKVQGR